MDKTFAEYTNSTTDHNSAYVAQMLGLYGLDKNKVPVNIFLDGDTISGNKGKINQAISEFLSTYADDVVNGVKHRLVESAGLLACKKALTYKDFLDKLNKTQLDIRNKLGRIDEKRELIYRLVKQVAEKTKELDKMEAEKDQALIDDLCGAFDATTLRDAFAKVSEGGKFVYSHSDVHNDAHRHFFALDHEVVLEGKSFGKYYFYIKLDKNNKPHRDDFSYAVRVFGLENWFGKDYYPHPHVDCDGHICWGNAYDDARGAYENEDYEVLFDQLFSLLNSYNDEDPYVSLSRFEEYGSRYAIPRYDEGKTVLENLNKVYTTEADTNVEQEEDERYKMIRSFIEASLAMKKEGRRISKWDIVFCGTDKKFYLCLGRSAEKVKVVSAEMFDKGIEYKNIDESDAYFVTTPPADKFKFEKTYTDAFGTEWIVDQRYEREDENGNKLEGNVVAIYPEYKTTKGTVVCIVLIKNDNGKVIPCAPDLKNFPTKNLTKVKEDEQESTEQ